MNSVNAPDDAQANKPFIGVDENGYATTSPNIDSHSFIPELLASIIISLGCQFYVLHLKWPPMTNYLRILSPRSSECWSEIELPITHLILSDRSTFNDTLNEVLSNEKCLTIALYTKSYNFISFANPQAWCKDTSKINTRSAINYKRY